MLVECLKLFLAFFKIGMVGFGGGYSMMSMILVESRKFSITIEQFADLTALDMIVPGPIGINAATYVGYLDAGFPGALAATLGVIAPSLIIVAIVMHFVAKFRQNIIMNSFFSGIKPAAVGLIAAAAVLVATGVLFDAGTSLTTFIADPLGSVSLFLAVVFIISAVVLIRFKVNPILVTLLAGVAGAAWTAIFGV